jgi:hypothetical protein
MIILFVFLVFFVSFFSDIVLNQFSIPSLRPYFHNQSMLKCAFDAGVTVLIGLIPTIFFSSFLGFLIPTTTKTLLYFCGIAFVIGFLLDKLIYKEKIFGDRLNLFYNTYGSGPLGAFAFLFAIVVSYFLQKFIYLIV